MKNGIFILWDQWARITQDFVCWRSSSGGCTVPVKRQTTALFGRVHPNAALGQSLLCTINSFFDAVDRVKNCSVPLLKSWVHWWRCSLPIQKLADASPNPWLYSFQSRLKNSSSLPRFCCTSIQQLLPDHAGVSVEPASIASGAASLSHPEISDVCIVTFYLNTGQKEDQVYTRVRHIRSHYVTNIFLKRWIVLDPDPVIWPWQNITQDVCLADVFARLCNQFFRLCSLCLLTDRLSDDYTSAILYRSSSNFARGLEYCGLFHPSYFRYSKKNRK